MRIETLRSDKQAAVAHLAVVLRKGRHLHAATGRQLLAVYQALQQIRQRHTGLQILRRHHAGSPFADV